MKGKSLEDINQLFEDRVSIKQFGKANLTKSEGGAGDTTWELSGGKDKTSVQEMKQDLKEEEVQ
jgi:hypothetical protein